MENSGKRLEFEAVGPDILVHEFTTVDGRKAKFGFMSADKPQRFRVDVKHTISIISGAFRINGQIFLERQAHVQELTWDPGQNLDIEALGVEGTFLCVYGDVQPMPAEEIIAILQQAKGRHVRMINLNRVLLHLRVYEVYQSVEGDRPWVFWANPLGLGRGIMRIDEFMHALILG